MGQYLVMCRVKQARVKIEEGGQEGRLNRRRKPSEVKGSEIGSNTREANDYANDRQTKPKGRNERRGQRENEVEARDQRQGRWNV